MDELMERAVETAAMEEGNSTHGAELRGSSFDYLTQPGADLAAKAQAFHAARRQHCAHRETLRALNSAAAAQTACVQSGSQSMGTQTEKGPALGEPQFILRVPFEKLDQVPAGQ